MAKCLGWQLPREEVWSVRSSLRDLVQEKPFLPAIFLPQWTHFAQLAASNNCNLWRVVVSPEVAVSVT
ncbi:MAG: hypothetical protein VB857_07240, partial [Pirellulaceae bacterium]